MGTAVMIDPEFGTEVHNDTDVPTSDVFRALGRALGPDSNVLRAMSEWTRNVQNYGPQSRAGSLFERDMYVTPDNVFNQMKLAYHAVEDDDVVANVAESTESLAFSRVSFQADDEDEEDVYNQIAADIDLDSRLREMWRELFTVSQFYVAIWWHTKEFKVRGKTPKGKTKKKTMSVRCPKALTMLDPLKILPVGSTMFNQERLVYIAERDEVEAWEKDPDEVFKRLILGKYTPSQSEIKWMSAMGLQTGATENLFLLNPENVFRHTATRPQFNRFAPVRMKSVFQLLDLKRQLRQMDRAHLIGGTNFIVLITKGSDALPAQPSEIAHLQAQVRTVARTPVLVGDHRLEVQIVTPKLDNTLLPARYNTVDSRITGRLYQMFVLGNYAAGTSGDDSVSLVKVIARGMESRRHMLRRTLEKAVFAPMFERNDVLTTPPKLVFHPKNIALDFDDAFASFLLDLRAANEISRETILSQFDMDQEDEARHREREKDRYDDIFQTVVPFSGPNPINQPGGPVDPGGANKTRLQRRSGGRSGGAAPGTGQGQPPRNPRKLSDEMEGDEDE